MPRSKDVQVTSRAAAGDVIADPRFSSFATDPRFRLPSKKNARTKIDKRFSRMLKDDDFSSTAKVDRYGRKIAVDSKKKALQRLYEDEDEKEDDEDHNGKEGKGEDAEIEDDDVVARELRRVDAVYDPARGGGFSSSEDEDDEDDQEDEDVEIGEEEEQFPDIREQADVPMGEVSNRIAVVNMDWDNVRAVDLLAVLSSFVPSGGRIQKVSVYKSEFGRERMDREEMEGPPKEIFGRGKAAPTEGEENEEDKDDTSESEADTGNDDEVEDDEDAEAAIRKELLKEDKGEEFDSVALRNYQLERLRYYYAVATCDSIPTAQAIYNSCDGAEYLSSANFFDLRFIPDDTEFDDKPRDESAQVSSGYKPNEFVTDALQHSKVKLTWDADDTERKEVIKRAFTGSRTEIGENDLKAYLGSDSSDNEEDDEVADGPAVPEAEEAQEAPKLTKKELARQKMRAALGLSTESSKASKVDGPVGDMQITFSAGLSAGEKGSVFQNEPIKEETTAEAYIRKEKERKARRKEKAKAARQLDGEANADATVAEETKEDADLGFNDPFFATDDATAKPKISKSLSKEDRRKRRAQKEAEAATSAKQRSELQLLMTEDASENASGRLDHFDINEIAKAEKARGKKTKNRSRLGHEAEDGQGGALQEGFRMDVNDPRFNAVFESHEYAIDPSNPKYKGTEGMKKLLEEGRKKRRLANEVVDDVVPKTQKSKSVKGANGLQDLVESVKKKVKR